MNHGKSCVKRGELIVMALLVSCSLSVHWLVTFKTQTVPAISWLMRSLPKVIGWRAVWVTGIVTWPALVSLLTVLLWLVTLSGRLLHPGHVFDILSCTALCVTVVNAVVIVTGVRSLPTVCESSVFIRVVASDIVYDWLHFGVLTWVCLMSFTQESRNFFTCPFIRVRKKLKVDTTKPKNYVFSIFTCTKDGACECLEIVFECVFTCAFVCRGKHLWKDFCNIWGKDSYRLRFSGSVLATLVRIINLNLNLCDEFHVS